MSNQLCIYMYVFCVLKNKKHLSTVNIFFKKNIILLSKKPFLSYDFSIRPKTRNTSPCLYITDFTAIKEAVKLSIPIVAVVDSNSDPDHIDFPIPGNDDAIRSIRLYCSLFADAALAGIQASLRNSGVDVGSAIKAKTENTMDGVKKIDKTAKVSKAKPLAKDTTAEVKTVKKSAATKKTSTTTTTATDSVAQ